jgi:hypothetical protein
MLRLLKRPITINGGLLVLSLAAAVFFLVLSGKHAENDREELKDGLSILTEISEKIEYAEALHEDRRKTHHIHNKDGTITYIK